MRRVFPDEPSNKWGDVYRLEAGVIRIEVGVVDGYIIEAWDDRRGFHLDDSPHWRAEATK